MVASAASSFRMNACASLTPTSSDRYSRRAPVEYYDNSDGSGDDAGASGDDGRARSSRYRLLDERERMQEAANVERMIQELQAQRKSRSRSQSARTSGTLRRATTTTTTHDFDPSTSSKSNYTLRVSATPTTEKQRRVSSARSPNATSASLDRAQTSSKARDPRTHPSTATTIRASANGEKLQSHAVKDRDDEPEASASASFQKQVLEEFQKLKQAQLKDLEAIRQLQREKERAERKARQLAEQFRSSKRSSTSSSSIAKHRTLVIDEPNASDDDEEEEARNNEQSFGDDDDLGDEFLSPPHYDDEGAPAPLEIDQTSLIQISPVDGDSDLDFLSSTEPSPVKWAKTSASASANSKAPPGLTHHQLEFISHSHYLLYTDCQPTLPCYGFVIESLSPVFTNSRSSHVFFSDDPPEFDDEQRGRSSRSRDLIPRAHERDQSSENQKQRAKFVQTWDSSESLDLNRSMKTTTTQSRRRTSRSRSPSVTRRISASLSRAAPHRHSYSRSMTGKSGEESDGGTEVRKSCSFFEEKQKEKEEETRLVIEAAERLERAKKALPPKQLLERQEQAKIKKDAQLRLLERELNAELSKKKRVKARDVPISTYVMVAAAPPPVSSSDGPDGTARQSSKSALFVTPEELEAQRKERIRQRSQQLLESAELPPRMALAMNGNGGAGGVAASTDQQNAMLLNNDTTAPTGAVMMSVKMKKQLAAAAEEEARKQRLKPKPVPNFDHLHAQWEKLMKSRKSAAMGSATFNEEGDTDETDSRKNTTASREFFTSRAAKLAELKAKKAARRQKQLEKEEQERRAQREAQAKLLEKTKASSSKQKLVNGGGAGGVSEAKPTKADELRVKRVLEKMVQSQKQQEKEAIEAERRQQKMKLAAKRVGAQVRASERSRIEGRSDYVSIMEIDQVAKQRAQEFKRSLKESIEQNKQRILGAVATKPSLMERFATDLKREEYKKNALEAVVKNVFGKNLGVMKGILTEEEHELARDIVAADEEEDAENEKNDNGARTSKKLKEEESDGEDEYSDA